MATEIAATPAASPKRARPAVPVRLAVVGCGAVARANLLPVIAGHERVRLVALVDRSEERAKSLADAYGVAKVLTDLDALSPADVDGVVLATPPAHHSPATIALAGRGLHVFVEKPMATNGADATAMVEAADHAGVSLAVGLYRRFLPAVALLKQLLATGEFGAPVAVDIEEGGPYGWPLASLDVLTRKGGGGGVLIDIGSHLIDEILYALPATPTLVGCQDNARGGIETDCLVHCDFALPTGARVPLRLELSRTRELRGSIRVQCEHATLELLRANFTQIVVHRAQTRDPNTEGTEVTERTESGQRRARTVQYTAEWPNDKQFIGYDGFRAQIDDWIGAMTGGTDPMISGRSVLPVVKLIDACYANRTSLTEPWTDEGLLASSDRRPSTSSGRPEPVEGRTVGHSDRRTARKRVLVTGAGGFVGGRTVEILREKHGYEVVALVREPKSAARLAQWPAEILLGDITSRDDMDRVLKGCDAVVHCAVGTSWKADEVRKVTVDGTRTVAEAAQRAGVSRFVHISTMFVHRRDRSGTIDETTPLEPPATDEYGQNKLLAEKALLEVGRRGLSSIILRPTRIYGPFSRTFTVRPLQALSAGHFAITGDADVPANMVYVDHVVQAIARAIEAPASLSGSGYLITDPEQVSLREFYEYFAATAGLEVRVVPASAAGETAGPSAGLLGRWISGVKTIAKSPEMRGIVRRILATDPIGTLPRRLWDRSPGFQNAMLKRFGADAAVVYRPPPASTEEDLLYWGEPARVSGAKAERELDFHPSLTRERAMQLTLTWARYARLLA